MKFDIVQFLATLVAGIVVAVLSAYVTVRLSLGRFREERRWEKKHEAYSNLVEALFRVLDYK